MSQSTVQLLLAALGVSGTLAAAVLTQVLQRKAERERRAADDARRWHADRFRVCKELLYKAMEISRILWSASSTLPAPDEYERIREAGYTSFLVVGEDDVPPYDGDPQVFTSTSLEIVREDLERAHALVEESEHLVAEISLLTDGPVSESAATLFRAALFAVGEVETTRGSREEAWRGVLAMKEPMAKFQHDVRHELGVTGTL
ncbi:hypothetical protein [Streptomyces sp. NBC_00076]|uniref:hypothetical protein n=1 Tax=Streptomyces sp. NBC_00076 TaxID=2975642 RepID=UPI003251AE0A